MRKYRIVIVLLIFLGAFLYLFKNTIASFLVGSYLKNTYRCASHFGSLAFSLNGVKAHDVTIIHKQGTFHADNVDVAFSFHDGIFSRLASFIESVRIKKGSIVAGEYVLDDFFLHKNRAKQYRLLIGAVRIKNKYIKNVQFLFSVNDGSIVLARSFHPYFGSSAYIEGIVRFDPAQDSFSLNLKCEHISLRNLMKIIYDKDDIILEGEYSGDILLSFAKNKLTACEMLLNNTTNGLIHIERQAPLTFLKKKMDSNAYAALTGSLKNYRYNKGTITAHTKDKTIMLELLFDSDILGKRTISVNYHKE